jgi:hypothetical protein
VRVNSWSVKGVSRGDVGEEGGSTRNRGGGREERRSETCDVKELTVEVISEGGGIGWRLSQRGRGRGEVVCRL